MYIRLRNNEEKMNEIVLSCPAYVYLIESTMVILKRKTFKPIYSQYIILINLMWKNKGFTEMIYFKCDKKFRLYAIHPSIYNIKKK